MKLFNFLFLSALLSLTIVATSCKDDDSNNANQSYTICCSDESTLTSLSPSLSGLSPVYDEDSVSLTVNTSEKSLCQTLTQACTTLESEDPLAQWAVVAYPSSYTGEMEDQEPTFEWLNGGDSIGPTSPTMGYNYDDTKTFLNHRVQMISGELFSIVEDKNDGRIATYNMEPERVQGIYTSVNWPLDVGDHRLFLRGCQPSDNLNKKCGWKTKNVYLGALSENTNRQYNDIKRLNPIGDITGLKLMASSTEWRPETVQKDGITWHICPSYEGSQDLNKWAGGSYLYLYYTTDYTGMQFYLAPAKALEYDTDDPFHRSVYGALCTWITDTAIKTQDFHSKDGLDINSDNVYFIPLVDKNFDPDCSEYPANFNHNTKGKNVYLSLPYVKVSK